MEKMAAEKYRSDREVARASLRQSLEVSIRLKYNEFG